MVQTRVSIMQYRVESNVKLIDRQAWEEFVKNHPNGNFFQSPQFYDYLVRTTTHKPAILVCYKNNTEVAGILVGMIPIDGNFLKRFFSSRIILIAGPLACDDDLEIINTLLESLIRIHGKSHIYFEFRNHFPNDKFREVFRNNGFHYHEHLNFILNTENREATYKKVNSGKKRQIKKSLESGARIVYDVSIDQVKEFYKVVGKLYTSRVKRPLPDWSFFEQFYYSPEAGRYILIEYKEKIIGGIMCPSWQNKIFYEWYVAGEDGVYEGIFPSVLATWAAIEYAVDNGYHHFDFMGAGKPGVPYGVREFKGKFGGELVNYGRYTKINQPLMYKIGNMGLSLLQKLK